MIELEKSIGMYGTFIVSPIEYQLFQTGAGNSYLEAAKNLVLNCERADVYFKELKQQAIQMVKELEKEQAE